MRALEGSIEEPQCERTARAILRLVAADRRVKELEDIIARYDMAGREDRVRYFTWHKDENVVICSVCGALVHKPSVQLHTQFHPKHQRPTAASMRKDGTWEPEGDQLSVALGD